MNITVSHVISIDPATREFIKEIAAMSAIGPKLDAIEASVADTKAKLTADIQSLKDKVADVPTPEELAKADQLNTQIVELGTLAASAPVEPVA